MLIVDTRRLLCLLLVDSFFSVLRFAFSCIIERFSAAFAAAADDTCQSCDFVFAFIDLQLFFVLLETNVNLKANWLSTHKKQQQQRRGSGEHCSTYTQREKEIGTALCLNS